MPDRSFLAVIVVLAGFLLALGFTIFPRRDTPAAVPASAEPAK